MAEFIYDNITDEEIPFPEIFRLTFDGYILLLISQLGEGLPVEEYEEKGVLKGRQFNDALRKLVVHGLVTVKTETQDGKKVVRLFLTEEAREIAEALEEFRSTLTRITDELIEKSQSGRMS